jgi:hypothetical protein
MSQETALQRRLTELFDTKEGKADCIMPRMAIVGVEYPLLSPNEVITRGTDLHLPGRSNKTNIGRVDVIFRYGRTYYVAEIKDKNGKDPSSFWYATKALAYCEYLKWQTDSNDYRPAVIIPADSLRLEHQIVSGKLGLTIFLFKRVNGDFKMRPIDDRPYWQQQPSW